MFGIGLPEMLLILVIALIVLGPEKLTEVAKFLGKALNEIKRATNEIKSSMDLDAGLKDIKKTFSEMNSTDTSSGHPASCPENTAGVPCQGASPTEPSISKDSDKTTPPTS